MRTEAVGLGFQIVLSLHPLLWLFHFGLMFRVAQKNGIEAVVLGRHVSFRPLSLLPPPRLPEMAEVFLECPRQSSLREGRSLPLHIPGQLALPACLFSW